MEDNIGEDRIESSNSWETASFVDLDLNTKRLRKDVKIQPVIMLQKMVEIYKELSNATTVPLYKNENIFEVEEQILSDNFEFDENPNNSKFLEFFSCDHHITDLIENEEVKNDIKRFLAFNANGVSCRIYFIFNRSECTSFLEYKLINIKEKKEKFSGLICSLDAYGKLCDQSYYFSKLSHTHWRSFKNFIKIFNKKFEGCSFFSKNKIFTNRDDDDNNQKSEINYLTRVFDDLDKQRLIALPKTLRLLKYHPLYVSESILKKIEIIFPRRPLIGTVANQDIYLRKNIWKLKSRNNWYYRHGMIPKFDVKPYKIMRDREFYASFQIEEVVIKSVDEIIMTTHRNIEGHHNNFTPKDCQKFYFNTEKERIAFLKYCKNKKITFKYAGVKKVLYIDLEPAIFIYKRDFNSINLIYKYFMVDYKSINTNLLYMGTLNDWKKIISKIDIAILKKKEDL